MDERSEVGIDLRPFWLYFFKFYALDVAVGPAFGATKAELMNAMEGTSGPRDNSWVTTGDRLHQSGCQLVDLCRLRFAVIAWLHTRCGDKITS